jgi:hypothetical protein
LHPRLSVAALLFQIAQATLVDAINPALKSNRPSRWARKTNDPELPADTQEVDQQRGSSIRTFHRRLSAFICGCFAF